MCTIRRKIIIITSYDVSIGSWRLTSTCLDWIDLTTTKENAKKTAAKQT